MDVPLLLSQMPVRNNEKNYQTGLQMCTAKSLISHKLLIGIWLRRYTMNAQIENRRRAPFLQYLKRLFSLLFVSIVTWFGVIRVFANLLTIKFSIGLFT